MTDSGKQLIIFVKSPLPGQCKTRLIPLLNPQGACDFYKSLVTHCFKQLTDLRNINIVIYAYPDIQDNFIKQLAERSNFNIHPQQGNNLGERMHNALQHSLSSNTKAVLIGTDCPLIDMSYITQAFDALDNHDIVIGPAEDGGYVLIGATQIETALFDNIQWSSDQVLHQSLEKVQAAGYTSTVLRTLWDIDTPEDFAQYHSEIKHLLS